MQCATHARSLPHPTSSNCSIVRRPNASSAKRSSSGSSARCVCSRTSSRSASSAVARINSGVTENGEHGASAMRTIAPHDAVVVQRDEPLAVGEDLVVVLHDRVGREPAVLLRQAHRAARSDGSARPSSCAARISARDEVAAAARVHVEMVGARRAAAERELGQPDPRRHVRRFLVEQRPARVQRRQPLEQRAVHRGPVAAGEVLVDVVVRVDQARA